MSHSLQESRPKCSRRKSLFIAGLFGAGVVAGLVIAYHLQARSARVRDLQASTVVIRLPALTGNTELLSLCQCLDTRGMLVASRLFASGLGVLVCRVTPEAGKERVDVVVAYSGTHSAAITDQSRQDLMRGLPNGIPLLSPNAWILRVDGDGKPTWESLSYFTLPVVLYRDRTDGTVAGPKRGDRIVLTPPQLNPDLCYGDLKTIEAYFRLLCQWRGRGYIDVSSMRLADLKRLVAMGEKGPGWRTGEVASVRNGRLVDLTNPTSDEDIWSKR